MRLAHLYSNSSGLRLHHPFIHKAFYPIVADKYIVFHNSSGNPCKNYDYFNEVIDLILPYLKEQNIKIIQLGMKGDTPLYHTEQLMGTTIHQTAYIISKASLLVGNDSMLVHMAGGLDVPVVGLYGATSVSAHSPEWRTSNSILIESHRDGKQPSYTFNENPKTVNFIDPVEVARAILKILQIENDVKQEVLSVGAKYLQNVLEVVPNRIIDNSIVPNAPINIRYDYNDNEAAVYQQVAVRKSIIITDKPLNIDYVRRLKQNIIAISYEITENHNPKFIRELSHVGIPIHLYTSLSDETLNDIKLDYCDIGLIKREPNATKEEIEDHKLITNNTRFKTNKQILSNGKIYLSRAHELMDIPAGSGNDIMTILDVPKFWKELEYFFIFNS